MNREIKIGILAIVATSLLIWGYKFLLGTNILKQNNTFYVEYHNIDNLQISDPALINGLQVGAVRNIHIKDNDLSKIVVVLEIDRSIKLPANTVAELKNSGMMGGKQIDLSYEGNCDSDCLQSGDSLAGKSLGFIQSMVQPSEIDLYMKSLKDNIGDVVDSLGHSLSNVDPQTATAQTVADLRITAANLKRTTELMNHLFASSSHSLSQVLQNLEAVTNNIKNNNDEISGLLQNANAISHQLASSGLDTTIISANRALESTIALMSRADATLGEMKKLILQMNEGEGTMGQLLSNPELYENLSALSKNLDLLLEDVREHPKRYINVSVFGKKEKPYVPPEDDPSQDH